MSLRTKPGRSPKARRPSGAGGTPTPGDPRDGSARPPGEGPLGVLVTGPSGQAIGCTDAALQLLGTSREDLLSPDQPYEGWDLRDRYGVPLGHEQSPAVVAAVTGSPVRNAVLDVYRPLYGDRTLLLVNTEPLFAADGVLARVTCTLSDIGQANDPERVAREQDRHDRYLVGLHDKAMGRLDSDHVRELLRLIVVSAGNLLGTGHGWIDLVDGDVLCCEVAIGDLAPYRGHLVARGQELPGRVWQSGEAVTVHDVHEHQWWSRLDAGVTALAAVPLKSGDEVIGVLGLGRKEVDARFSRDEVAVLNSFGDLAALALENARLYQQQQQTERSLERQNAYLAALNATTVALVNHLEPGALLHEIVERSAELIGTTHGYIYLLDEQADRLRVEVGIGLFADFIGHELAWGEGIGGRIWQTGKAIQIADYHAWPGRVPGFGGLPFAAAAGAPLKDGETTIGVIGLVREKSRGVFSSEEIDLLDRFSRLASLALQNANLYRALQNQLSEMGQAERAVREALDYAEDLVNSATAIVLSIDREGMVVSANPALLEISGYKRDEVVGKRWDAFVERIMPAGRYPQAWDALKGISDDDMPLTLEAPLLSRSGKEHYISWRLSALTRDGVAETVCFGVDISEGRRTQEALGASERRFRSLVQNATDVVGVLDQNFVVMYESPSIEKILGYRPEELIGRSVADFLHPSDRDLLADFGVKLLEAKEPLPEFRFRFRHKDGGYRHFESVATNLLGDPTVLGIVINSRDITERQSADEALQRNVEDLQALYDLSATISHTRDDKQIYKHALATLKKLLGADRAAILVLDEDGAMSFRAWSGLSARYRRTVDGLSPWPAASMDPQPLTMPSIADEAPLNHIDMPMVKGALSEEGIAALAHIPLFHGKLLGRMVVYFNAPHDFSERELQLAQTVASHVAFALDRQRAEKAIEASEERFRSLVQNSGDVLEIVDADGVVTYVSGSVTQVIGYEPEELVGTDGFKLVHPDDRQAAFETLSRMLASPGSVQEIEFRARHKDGGWTELEATARNLLGDPNIRGIVVNMREIGERKRAAEALQASEVRFRTLVQNASDITAVITGDATFLYLSPAVEPLMGYRPEEMVGRSALEFVHPDDLPHVAETLAIAVQRPGPTPPVQLRMLHSDGGWRFMEAVGTNLLDDPVIRGIVINGRDITDRKEAEAQLSDSEQRFRDLFENANDMVYTRDLEGRITAINKLAERLTGYSREELIGRPITELMSEADAERSMMTLDNAPSPDDDDIADVVEFIRKDGTTVHVEVRARLIWKDGQPVAVQGIARDISERLEAAAARQAGEDRFRSLVQNALDVIALISLDGTISYVSPSIERLSGFSVDEITGSNVGDYLHPDDLAIAKQQVAQSIENPDFFPAMEFRFRHRDGGYRYLEGSGRNLIGDPTVEGYVINARDISERKHFEEELARQAFYDRLTGLPNRALFVDRLGHALATSQRSKAMLAVLFLDVDRFKVINDSLGHSFGDQILAAVGGRLRNSLRPGDSVARWGGDEFTILLEDVPSEADATHVAQRVIDDLAAPFHLAGHEIFISASIGIAFARNSGARADDLLRDADVALYRAKTEGRSRYVVFDEEMNLRAIERLDIENDLRRAVKANAFNVHYQPEVDLDSGELLGFEALARWQHPRFGYIDPAEFIRMAEDNGLIVPLGHFILTRACRQLKRWQDRTGSSHNLSMSVNLSARQLQEDTIVEDVRRVIAEAGIDPACLILEVTESVAVEEDQVVARKLNALRALGIRVAIDDFGAGYTSLNYLTRITADILKIDRSFVNGIENSEGKASIVSALISLAHGFGLSIVAEGIEKQSQLDRLRSMQCERGQGYLFSRALPAALAGRLLTKRSLLPSAGRYASRRAPRAA